MNNKIAPLSAEDTYTTLTIRKGAVTGGSRLRHFRAVVYKGASGEGGRDLAVARIEGWLAPRFHRRSAATLIIAGHEADQPASDLAFAGAAALTKPEVAATVRSALLVGAVDAVPPYTDAASTMWFLESVADTLCIEDEHLVVVDSGTLLNVQRVC